MINYPKAKILHNVFSVDELEEISRYFEKQPIDNMYSVQNTINKNLDYDIPASFANIKIKPKISKILNDTDHKFFGGAYKEYSMPYPLHIDNTLPTASMVFDCGKKHETAILIPLMEGEQLKTAMFDVFMPIGHNFALNCSDEERAASLSKFLQHEKTTINVDDFTHIKEPFASMLPYIPLDNVFKWQMGSVIMWHFDQLHCSTDFAKDNLIKKFIVIMIN